MTTTKEKIKERMSKEFLGIRGWKTWEEYDKVGSNSDLDRNIREEIINLAIKETLKETEEFFKERTHIGALKIKLIKFLPYEWEDFKEK